MKPLGCKSYGSIPHFQGSRLGPADHHCSPGQETIATKKARDKHDFIIVQEKLDGGNVGICKVNGKILAITRAGYLAETSPFKTHHAFKLWVEKEEKRFNDLLNEGERVCGEWLLTAVGTKYNLPHEPFVAFDLIHGKTRYAYHQFVARLAYSGFTLPQCLSMGQPLDIESAMTMLEVSAHGALEPVEGAIWRVERRSEVDFLCKYVRGDKVDGKYLNEDVFNDVLPEHKYLIDYYQGLELPPRQQQPRTLTNDSPS
jgi:hypothetical protein